MDRSQRFKKLFTISALSGNANAGNAVHVNRGTLQKKEE